VHDALDGSFGVLLGDFAIGGDGNLEKPDPKRNRKVFHKSLSLLWIADVEYCR